MTIAVSTVIVPHCEHCTDTHSIGLNNLLLCDDARHV